MACGCGDDKIYKEGISSNSNNELTAVVVQDGSLAECSNEWVRSVLKEGHDSFTKYNTIPTKRKIQKVPQVLRLRDQSSQKCYNPQVISIGPYHHGKEELKPMEKIKKCLTWEFVNRCAGTSADQLYNKIVGLAEEARKCYADDDEASMHHFDNKEFAQMMFLDGCFLLEFIFCSIDDEDKKEEKLKLKTHVVAFIQQDLFLLENQLPFIVLKALMSFTSYGETKGFQKIKQFIHKSWDVPPPRELIREKAENFITDYITCRSRGVREAPKAPEYKDDPAHLLELLRREIIDPNAFNVQDQGDKNKTKNSSMWYSYRTVQELKAAGIIFRPNRSELNLLTNLRYELVIVRAVLRLPVIAIDDSTKSLLLNLVAYEMCPDSPNDYGVSSYLWLMDTLIDHPDDVKELRQRGILLNVLASDEQVAKLFNEIADNLVPNPNAYANVKWQIEKHYKNKVKMWITEFVHAHFHTPWTILTFIGAIVVIALSFIQSYYAVKQCQ